MSSTSSAGGRSGEVRYAIGVDIGGTFTDLALVNQSSGKLSVGKVLTDASDVSRGVMRGLHNIFEKTGVAPRDVHVLFMVRLLLRMRCLNAGVRPLL